MFEFLSVAKQMSVQIRLVLHQIVTLPCYSIKLRVLIMKFIFVAESVFACIYISGFSFPFFSAGISMICIFSSFHSFRYLMIFRSQIFKFSIAFLTFLTLASLHDSLKHSEIRIHFFSLFDIQLD